MKISIITVSFNSVETINSTFDSIESQTYNNIEYIVVDGGSTDGTLDLIKSREKIISKWVSESDNGLYDAMNKGIRMAKGDVIGILNSDDLFCNKDAVKKVMEIFKKNRNLDSVYADLYYVSQNNTENIVRKWITGNQKKFSTGWHPAHPTFYVKREVYNKYGIFNLSYKLASDFEIMLRFLEKYNISTYYLKSSLVKMRLGGETNKNLNNIFNQNKECIRAFKENELKINSFTYPFVRILPKLFQFRF